METSATDHESLLKIFINNGWHGKNWERKVTRAVLIRDGRMDIYDKSSYKSQHVELTVLNDLCMVSSTNTRITLLLTYSPCSDCCPKIITFLRSHEDIKLQLHIVFPALFNIVRPSCKRTGCAGEHIKDDDYKEANIKALQDLYQVMGDNLRPFSEQDWMDLQTALDVTDDEINDRKQEDENLLDDFKSLMKMRDNVQQSSEDISDINSDQKGQPKENRNEEHTVPSASSKQDASDLEHYTSFEEEHARKRKYETDKGAETDEEKGKNEDKNIKRWKKEEKE